jgi:hypothetical protein
MSSELDFHDIIFGKNLYRKGIRSSGGEQDE